MIRISLGYLHDYGKFIDYMSWLAERDLLKAMLRDDKIFMVEFEDAEDAVAFKLKFDV